MCGEGSPFRLTTFPPNPHLARKPLEVEVERQVYEFFPMDTPQMLSCSLVGGWFFFVAFLDTRLQTPCERRWDLILCKNPIT